MALLRKHQRVTYTVVDNGAVRDPEMSWKATGLLVYLLGQPDNWKVNVKQLTGSKTDGRDAVQSGLTELETLGYLQRRVVRDAKGHLQTIIDVAESPELLTALADQPSMDFPSSVNPQQTTPKSEGQPMPGLPIPENPSDGKSAHKKEHKKKEPKRSNARASHTEEEEEEKTLRALALERAARKGANNPEGLAAKILAEDRDDLIRELAERRAGIANLEARAGCPDCDELGFAWYDLAGNPVPPDDPVANTSDVCTHPTVLEAAR